MTYSLMNKQKSSEASLLLQTSEGYGAGWIRSHQASPSFSYKLKIEGQSQFMRTKHCGVLSSVNFQFLRAIYNPKPRHHIEIMLSIVSQKRIRMKQTRQDQGPASLPERGK